MASKRNRGEEGSSSKSKGKAKLLVDVVILTPHGINFCDDTQKYRYEALVKRKVVNIKYLDDNTLEVLGLMDDVYWIIE